jgi:hypothetical protein
MATGTRTIRCTCLCGASSHEVTQPASAFPLTAHFCHCDSCRHMTGALCLTIAKLVASYQPDQSFIDKLQSFNFSENITWYHCPTCGTQMLARIPIEFSSGAEDRQKYRWILATGSLDQAEDVFEVHGHEWITDTLDGGFADFLQTCHGDKPLERWPRHFGQEGDEQVPLYWRSPSPLSPSSTVSDKLKEEEGRLKAHCKCHGVEFWVARPSARSAMGAAPWPDLIIPFYQQQAQQQQAPVQQPEDKAWWLRAQGTKFLAGCCSCDSCRLATGMEWIQWAFVPTIDITLDAEGTQPFTREFGTMKHYRSSKEATRHFCGTCGTDSRVVY